MKTRRKTTTGSRLFALLLAMCVLSIAGGKKDDNEPYAVVAGTVFRDPGFALPGATVILTLRSGPKAKKLSQAVTSPRGEFSFRVPPDPATYVVKASFKGLQPEEKEAAVSGPVRIDVTLTLSAESK
jgi:Carboxypeptidase regulatory-like domain